MRTQQIVEAVLFASDAPLSAEEIARADEILDEDSVEETVRLLRSQYQEQERAFELVEVADGYQILTRPEFAPYLERFDTVPRSSRLSGPSLETLAIIAYRQPIDRLEIEYIRGVGAAGVIRTLQDRGMIETVGRAEGIGRPLLYGTTRRFLEHFGFTSLEDLPRPEDLPIVLGDRSAPLREIERADYGSLFDARDGDEGEVASGTAAEAVSRAAADAAFGAADEAASGAAAEAVGPNGRPEAPPAPGGAPDE